MIDYEKIYTDFDTQLMLRVKHGNFESYEILYARHFSDVNSFFAKIGNVNGYSEDLAQKVFIYIWKNRESFRADSTFKTYIYSIAKKILYNHIREMYKNAEISKNAVVSNIKKELSEPEAAYHCTELLKNLEMNKSKLPPKQRQAIELLLDPDFTPETAAKQANCSNNTYLKRLSDARKRLKKLLKI
ncbi:MAG: RNA polymerase sigma factor [Sedimentisphaerales bacterium]|nr:RNA polymerase sigma factor [Sedimentisphaerales bacterium]